jgi:hypothetical protein
MPSGLKFVFSKPFFCCMNEIAVKCSACGARGEGESAALEAKGWRLDGERVTCPQCTALLQGVADRRRTHLLHHRCA